jgi:hypothetical protein
MPPLEELHNRTASPQGTGLATIKIKAENLKRVLPPSSLLKNLEMESFRILAGSCWGGAVELDVISSLVLGAP